MKDKMLKSVYRYDALDDSYHVVIDLDTYRDVYSEWDYSPVTNRDLDEDLIEYLLDCSIELALKRKMVVDFYIPSEIVNHKRERKSVNGFRHYFAYQIRRIKSDRLQMLKNSTILLAIGILFLTIAILSEGKIDNHLLSKLVTEGLFIGAWVALWEIFSTLFFDVKKLSDKINHYDRLMKIDINYKVKN
jgi:hypothetical protein